MSSFHWFIDVVYFWVYLVINDLFTCSWTDLLPGLLTGLLFTLLPGLLKALIFSFLPIYWGYRCGLLLCSLPVINGFITLFINRFGNMVNPWLNNNGIVILMG